MNGRRYHIEPVMLLFSLLVSMALIVMTSSADATLDQQVILLQDEIIDGFETPIQLDTTLKLDVDIRFVLSGKVTFTAPSGAQKVLTIDGLQGSDATAEYTVYLDEIGIYSIKEQFSLSVQTNNFLLNSFFKSLTKNLDFDWTHENHTAGDATYTLSSVINDLNMQLSGDLTASLVASDPDDPEWVTISIPALIPENTMVDYVINYSVKLTKESSLISFDAGILLNSPPKLDSIPDVEVFIGDTLEIILSATDPDGGILTYTASGAPMENGAQLNGNVFTWQLTNAVQAGNYTITFIVEDPEGNADRETVRIRVCDQEQERDRDQEGLDDGDGFSKRMKPEKLDLRIRRGEAKLTFKGYLPPIPAFDTDVLLSVLDGLTLSGNLGAVDCQASVDLKDVQLDQDGNGGVLQAGVTLTVGGMDIVDDDLVELRFKIYRYRNLFKFYADGQSQTFGDIELRITGIIDENGMVNTPMANLCLECANDMLSEIGPIDFLTALPDFPLDQIPGSITIGGSFEGNNFTITLNLSELVEKAQKNRIAVYFTANLQLDIDGVIVEIPLKCKFVIKSKTSTFSVSVLGRGTGVQKVELRIAGKIVETEAGLMVTQPIVKLMIIFKPWDLLDEQGDAEFFGDDGEIADNESEGDEDDDDDNGTGKGNSDKDKENKENKGKDNKGNGIKEDDDEEGEDEDDDGIKKKPKDKGNKGPKSDVLQPLLLQNFPNPFNPETWISYQLHESCDVTVMIHDCAGKLVRTLDLGYKGAGSYVSRSDAAYWDGKNNSGEEVASGLYFYTIQADKFTATRKMLILK